MMGTRGLSLYGLLLHSEHRRKFTMSNLRKRASVLLGAIAKWHLWRNCFLSFISQKCRDSLFYVSLLCFTSSWKLCSSGIILLVFLHVVYLSTWEYKPCECSTVQAYVLRAMQGISQVDSKYFLNELMPSDALVLMCRNAPYSPPSRWEEDMWTCTLSLRSI